MYKGSMNWEREAASRLPGLLESWLRSPAEPVTAPLEAGQLQEVDFAVTVAGRLFVCEVKARDDVATLERAARHVQGFEVGADAVRLIAVPFMGPKARKWAAEHGVSWVDLSGNTDIHADSLHIVVSGEKNRYASPGRPSNPFTTRYSRVSRALLAKADRWWKQVDLAEELDLPSGTVSKVVQHLDALELLERNDDNELRARAPSLLLDSWAQRYRFGDHALRRYHVTARSGSEALQGLADRLAGQKLRWAATGLSAAWLYTAFAGFRLNTFLIEQHPADPEELGLRPVERGGRTSGSLSRRTRGPSTAASSRARGARTRSKSTWTCLLIRSGRRRPRASCGRSG